MCRILVVDDTEDNVFLLKTLLELEGYTVDTACNGWDALHKIQATRPDIVLLDIIMPDMSGYSVTQRVRQDSNLSATSIILVTSFSVLEADEGLSKGADAFIQKPIDADQLIATVKRFCDRKSDSA
ncbi:MAG TPA: response regulator [Coleofasciculaceae cyanobacterium]